MAFARYFRSAPLTSALIVVIWVLAIVSGAVALDTPATVLGAVATGPDTLLAGRWWTVLTAPLWCADLPGYLITTGLLVAVVAPAEKSCGTRRIGVLMLVTQVATTVIAAVVVLLAAAAGDEWTELLAGTATAGAGPMAIGVGMAFTTRFGALWRRRLRLVALLLVFVLVAYSGTLHDVIRMVAALTGMVVGPRLLGRSPRSGELITSWRERRVLVALVVAGTAIGPIVAALSDTPIGPLSVLRFLFLAPNPDAATVQRICLDPAMLDDCRTLRAQLRLGGVGPAVMSAMPVVLLLTAAVGLRRGRRSAWVVAILVNGALAALGVLLAGQLFGTGGEQLAVFGGLLGTQALIAILLPLGVPLVVAGLLWRNRDAFDVQMPALTRRRVLRVVMATLVTVSVVYVVLGRLVRDQFDQPPTVAGLLADLPTRFVPPGYLGELTPRFLPVGTAATVLYEWSGVVFFLVLAGALASSFRRNASGTDATDRAQAAGILHRHGGTSLSYLTLWPGNSYHLTPDRTAYIAYRVVGSVAVSVTGPVGAPGARGDAALGFAAWCATRGLTPCLYSVPTDVRDVVGAELGWRSVQVAEETLLPLPTLTFTGKRWQDVRTALNKATKTGIAGQWWSYAHAPVSVTEQVKAISEQWVADKGLPEMGFTLGGLDELADEEVRCLVAVDAHHTVHGITSFLPVHRDGAVVGWTLDFMRRRPGGFVGVMEFLIATAALEFQEEGAEFLSLSGAPLARIDRGADQDPVQRLLDTLGRALEPVYGFRSLLDFKAKFQPVYQPLWMSYPEAAALPGIAGAISRCYLPHLGARQGGRLLRRLTRRPRLARTQEKMAAAATSPGEQK
ncbi:MAG: DUF2156 domain-containing protein [Nakamurella sp.]